MEVKSNVEKLELYSDDIPFSLSLRIRNFENEADYKKFIRNCEAMLRKSIEYKLWRKYIVDVLGINECMITNEKMSEVTIDVHHHIPSLFTMIKGIINKYIDNEEEFCTFDITEKAIELHYKNKVGYVTILKSLHEKFHNGFLQIPIDLVKGDYNYFLKNYGDHLDEEELDTINDRLVIKETDVSWLRNEYPAEALGG
jgi:hypothetical protein